MTSNCQESGRKYQHNISNITRKDKIKKIKNKKHCLLNNVVHSELREHA
jgi:hypothetical protein